jgi:hypothetical protein
MLWLSFGMLELTETLAGIGEVMIVNPDSMTIDDIFAVFDRRMDELKEGVRDGRLTNFEYLSRANALIEEEAMAIYTLQKLRSPG